MARSVAVDLSARPHRSHARVVCCSAQPSSMLRVASSQYIRDRGVWSAVLFLAVVAASLFPLAAAAQCASRQICTEPSLGKNCSGDRDFTKTDSARSLCGDRRDEQDCLEVDVASVWSLDSAEAASTGLVFFEQEQGGIVMPASHMKASAVTLVRLFYAPEDEQQPVGKGTLVDGRYLLIDLLHPPGRKRPQAAFPKGIDFTDSDDLALQLQSSPHSPHTAADRGGCEDGDRDHWTTQSSSTGLWQWLRDSPSTSAIPGFSLLLTPAGRAALTAGAGAAFAAAVVSVHSELVLAKLRDQPLEGFCIDPFIILRAFPFWLQRPLLPDPGSSSSTSTSGRGYRLFGRLGGGAYGEASHSRDLRVWRAVSVDSAAPVVETVLKRMYCRAFDRDAASTERPEEQRQQKEQEARVRRGFAREVFFGLWFRGLPHIARFLEVLPADPHGLSPEKYDEQAAPPLTTTEGVESAAAAAAAAAATFLPEMSIDELATAARSAAQGCHGEWLVFANEGISLTHLFFVADTGGSGLLEPLHGNPSELLLFLRSLLQQLLQALHAAHKRHVTHRDVKLENVLLHSSLPPDARLADWGSAVSNDEDSPVARALKALLGDESPSLLEETDGYQPPEVWAEAAALEGQEKQEECQHQGSDASASSGTCSSKDSGNAKPNNMNSLHRPPSYDIWGVGLIFLKLVLGTPTPLEPLEGRRGTRRARETLEKSHAMRRRDMLVTTLGDLCLIPWSSDRLPARAPTTAVAAAPPHTFFSSLKSALVSVADGFYRRWLALFSGDASGLARVNDATQEHYDLVAQDASASARNASWQKSERRKEELFELLSRVRGERGGGELVIRQHLAVQRQQRSGVRAAGFSSAEEEEALRHQTVPSHHHSDCNDTLFAEILKARDAAGVGVPNPLARDLLRKLLAYDPQERLTAEAALQHPWFAVASQAAGAVNEPKNKDS
ncbi:hypothetical protein Esti_002797 [Eimeria stiedai]